MKSLGFTSKNQDFSAKCWENDHWTILNPLKASTKCWKQPILGFLRTFPIRNPSMDAGQRPTEKRIFYAGSTLGPNRMVRLAQGRTGAAEAISDGSTGQHDWRGPEMAKLFSIKMY
jgi:hypothetical protein